MNLQSIFIICDNSRIGGIQRLAMDQSYQFSDMHLQPYLIFMSPNPSTDQDSFLLREQELLAKSNIQIRFMGISRIHTILNLAKTIVKVRPSIIICHSLRSSVVSFIVSKFLRKNNIKVKSCIHQLPALSAPIQRFRRYLYAQFSHELYGYSKAVVSEWQLRFESSFINKPFASRLKIQLLRNGIYLPRVPYIENLSEKKKELCFVGRLTNWKGLETFLTIARLESMRDFKLKIAAPIFSINQKASIENEFRDRVKLLEGKTFSELGINSESILIYPVNYGVKGAIESISINVLEALASGARCLVSFGGCETWPEFSKYEKVLEINWDKLTEQISLNSVFFEKELSHESVNTIRKIVDVRHNCLVLSKELYSE